MNIIRGLRLSSILNAAILLIVGLMMIIDPRGSSTTIAWIAGIFILVLGAIEILRYIRNSGYSYMARGGIVGPVLKVVLGIFIITHTGSIVNFFAIIFAIFVIVNGVMVLENGLMLRKGLLPTWYITFLLGIALIIAGVAMFFAPVSTSNVAMVIVGVVLLIAAAVQIYTLIQTGKINAEIYQAAKDAEDEANGNIIDI